MQQKYGCRHTTYKISVDIQSTKVSVVDIQREKVSIVETQREKVSIVETQREKVALDLYGRLRNNLMNPLANLF